MCSNIRDKYIKYKLKYLSLSSSLREKNILCGGFNIRMFDLSKNYNFPKNDLQNNLILFEKKFGEIFKLKYNGHIIYVKLIKTRLPNNTRFYRMIYDIPHRTTHLTPFIIDFIDILTGTTNNNSYISNIHKTNLLSGSASHKCAKL